MVLPPSVGACARLLRFRQQIPIDNMTDPFARAMQSHRDGVFTVTKKQPTGTNQFGHWNQLCLPHTLESILTHIKFSLESYHPIVNPTEYVHVYTNNRDVIKIAWHTFSPNITLEHETDEDYTYRIDTNTGEKITDPVARFFVIECLPMELPGFEKLPITLPSFSWMCFDTRTMRFAHVTRQPLLGKTLHTMMTPPAKTDPVTCVYWTAILVRQLLASTDCPAIVDLHGNNIAQINPVPGSDICGPLTIFDVSGSYVITSNGFNAYDTDLDTGTFGTDQARWISTVTERAVCSTRNGSTMSTHRIIVACKADIIAILLRLYWYFTKATGCVSLECACHRHISSIFETIWSQTTAFINIIYNTTNPLDLRRMNCEQMERPLSLFMTSRLDELIAGRAILPKSTTCALVDQMIDRIKRCEYHTGVIEHELSVSRSHRSTHDQQPEASRSYPPAQRH